MSNSIDSLFTAGAGADSGAWWSELGLAAVGADSRLTARVLGELRPVGFAVTGSTSGEGTVGGQVLSQKQVAQRLAAARVEEEARRARVRERLSLELVVAFEAALVRPDGDVPVTEGRWAGFTRAEAEAWSWALFEFEPRGIAHPGSQLRYESQQRLRAGDLPEAFGYPERARRLADSGLTPRAYRDLRIAHREALKA